MIAQTQQEKRILALAEPLAEEMGLEVVRVRMTGGRRPGLQIMLDKAGGALADVEDCADFSRALSPILDAEDPISGAFVLEVSTPGIDRPLTRPGDFAKWEGHLAKVELAMPLDGQRRFRGVILGEDENGVHLELDGEVELTAGVDEMTKASLVLTDDLIDEAARRGGLPPQPDEDEFAGFETDETEDEDSDDREENGAAS
ncbi:MAG: ribosome maturation factor RimP [Hyphomonadaceae bacterium]|nr:ribosome maturation factor RimP [Hyphomonadaceae bacterium]